MPSSCKLSRTGGLCLAVVLMLSLAGGAGAAGGGTKHSEPEDVTHATIGTLFGVGAGGSEAPLFAGTELPDPPRQSQPWTPPPSEFSPAFVSAASRLFEQGLPDPRGCEYREVLVGRPTLLLDHKLEFPRWEHGWLLPRKHKSDPRFALLWDGVLRPAFGVGKKLHLRQDVTHFLAAFSKPPEEPLRACLLLRLGEPELAAACWPDAQSGTHSGYRYYDVAREWVWNLYIAAIHAHMRADDHLALLRLRKLAEMHEGLEAEAKRSGARSIFQDEPFYFLEFQTVPVLLLDQERRALGLRTLPAGEFTEEARIYWRICDLEQVDIQAPGLDNPGFPDLAEDPLVQSLVREGAPAVEPLLRCMEIDLRLTRSVASWRFFHKGGEMIPVDPDTVMEPVASAAYVALAGILGAEGMKTIRANAPDAIWALPWPTRNRRLAAIIRAYWWTQHPELKAGDYQSVVNFDLENVTVREGLDALFRGRKSIAYIVDPVPPEVRVSVRCQGLPFPQALRLFAAQVREQVPGFLWWGRNDSTYYVFIIRNFSSPAKPE